MKKRIKLLYKKLVSYFFFFIYSRPILNLNFEDKKNYIEKVFSYKKEKYNIFKIINGRLYNATNHVAYLSKNFLLKSPSFQYKDSKNSNIKNNITLIIGTPSFLKKLKGKVFSLLSGGGAKSNYGHWLFDVLPRIFLLNKFFSIKKIDKFLVPSIKYDYQLITLNLLGIKKKKLIESNNFRHLQASELYSTSHPNNHNFENISAWTVKFLRENFLKKKSSKIYNFEKVYLDRGEFNLFEKSNNNSKFKDHRIIINEKEIKSFLIEKGFKILKPYEFNFLDQVNIFSRLKFIISLFGAGLTNICFCKERTKVIEIKTIKAGDEWLNLSKLVGLDHYQISLKPIIKSGIPQNGLLFCNLNKIKKAINVLEMRRN
jgi:capsular polysaccharide biosynthesis protein